MANTYTQRLIKEVQADPIGKATYDQAIARGVRPAEAANAAKAAIVQSSIVTAGTAGAAIRDIGAAAGAATNAIINQDLVGAEDVLKRATEKAQETASALGLSETKATAPAAAAGGKKEVRRFYLGSGKNRMLVIQYDDGSEEQIPAPAGEVEKEKVQPTGEQRSAFALLKDQLAAWGLADLTDWAIQLYQSENAPVNYNEFYALMKQQPIYVERFGKTNDARTKAGLAQLSEGEIMKLEQGYRDIMKAYNLPANFYDSPSDYRQFITNDLSASELGDRVQAANAYVKLQDKGIKDQLKQYYGIDDAALTAYALDPAKGQDVINTLAAKNTARIAAATAGLGEQAVKYASGLGAEQLSFAKQAQAFGEAANAANRGAALSQIYGTQYGQDQALQEAFGGPSAVQAGEARRKLATQETAAFSGGSGVGKMSLGGFESAGQL